MTAIETQTIPPERLDIKPFDGHEYCVDIYEAARRLPVLVQVQEGDKVVTKERKPLAGGGEVYNEIKSFDELTEEADIMASWGLEQFRREHPGMGDKRCEEFARVVRGFSIFSDRLSKTVENDVTKMSDLTPDEFGETITSLSDMYLQSVRSEERRDAENALGEYASYLIELEAVGGQSGRMAETIAA